MWCKNLKNLTGVWSNFNNPQVVVFCLFQMNLKWCFTFLVHFLSTDSRQTVILINDWISAGSLLDLSWSLLDLFWVTADHFWKSGGFLLNLCKFTARSPVDFFWISSGSFVDLLWISGGSQLCDSYISARSVLLSAGSQLISSGQISTDLWWIWSVPLWVTAGLFWISSGSQRVDSCGSNSSFTSNICLTKTSFDAGRERDQPSSDLWPAACWFSGSVDNNGSHTNTHSHTQTLCA